MLLFLVLVGNQCPPCFDFYIVTHSYPSHPFLCALGRHNARCFARNYSSIIFAPLLSIAWKEFLQFCWPTSADNFINITTNTIFMDFTNSRQSPLLNYLNLCVLPSKEEGPVSYIPSLIVNFGDVVSLHTHSGGCGSSVGDGKGFIIAVGLSPRIVCGNPAKKFNVVAISTCEEEVYMNIQVVLYFIAQDDNYIVN